jgi:hypothetical protein
MPPSERGLQPPEAATRAAGAILLALCCAAGAGGASEAGGAEAGPPEPGSVAAGLLAGLQQSYETEAAEGMSLEPGDPLASPELLRWSEWRFRSSGPVPGGGAGKTYLRFRLRVQELASPAAAVTALERFLATADPDTGHTYAWDHVLLDGSRVYWLSAGCLYSQARFEELASGLQRAVLDGRSAAPGHTLRCDCGRGCRRLAGP